jgi:LytTr DNA-binding domain
MLAPSGLERAPMTFADPSILIFRPLRMPGICAVVATLALLFAAYCMLHGVVVEGSVHPAVSIAWGLSHALCWWPAWECVKRAGSLPRRIWWAATIAGVCVAALVLNVVWSYGLSVLVSPESHSSWESIAYQRFPVACVLAIAAAVLHPWRGRATSRESGQAAPVVQEEGLPRSRDERLLATETGPWSLPRTPEPSSDSDRSLPPQPTTTILRLPTRQGEERVSAADIDYIKAAGNYVELFGYGRSWLLRATLHEMAAKLDTDGFARVHRSMLVNRGRVLSVVRSGQRQWLAMRCGERLPVGRQYLHVAQTFVTDAPGSTAFVPEPERSSPEV